MRDGDSSEVTLQTTERSAVRMTRLGILGGSFYLLLGAAALFYLGRYTFRGAPGPFWVSVLGVATVGTTLGAGVWMIRAGLRGPTDKTAAWLRRLASGAVASLLWVPLDLLDVVQGPLSFAVAAAAFFVTESLVIRWVGQASPPEVGTGTPADLLND